MTDTRVIDGASLGLTPATLARIVYHDLRDTVEDAANRLPPEAQQMTIEAIRQLRDDLSRALAQSYRLEDASRQAEACANAKRGMQNDIGPAGYEWAWEAGE